MPPNYLRQYSFKSKSFALIHSSQQSKPQKALKPLISIENASIENSFISPCDFQSLNKRNYRTFSIQNSKKKEVDKKTIEKLKKNVKKFNLFDESESEAFMGDVIPQFNLIEENNESIDSNESNKRNKSETKETNNKSKVQEQNKFEGSHTEESETIESIETIEELERRKKIEENFETRRLNHLSHPWEPFLLSKPLDDPFQFKIPYFFSQDEAFEYILRENEGWNISFESLNNKQKRIYILWLLWKTDYENTAKYIHNFLKSEDILTIQAVNDLIFLCGHLQYQRLGNKIFTENVIEKNIKPNRNTFMILWTFYSSSNEKFSQHPEQWRKLMQTEKIEWDADFESIRLGRDIFHSKRSSESLEAYINKFWWPINKDYKEFISVPKDYYLPTPLTYIIFIAECSKDEYFLVEKAYQFFLESELSQNEESFENITTQMLLFLAENKMGKNALDLFKKSFTFSSTNSPTNSTRFSTPKIAPSEKLLRLISFKLLKKKLVLWEQTLEFLEILQRNSKHIPKHIFRLYLNKLLQSKLEMRHWDERLAAKLFIQWCCPQVIRKIVIVDDYANMGKKNSRDDDYIEKKDEGWTKYDLRLLEDDFDQFTQVSKRVSKVEKTVENPLNYYTPSTEIHEFINFKERLYAPTLEEYLQIMSHIGKFGFSEEGSKIIHIYEADGSIVKTKETELQLYANMVTAFCKDGKLGNALVLFNKHFKSALPDNHGKFEPTEYLLFAMKNALHDVGNTAFERIIEDELILLRSKKNNPNYLYASI